MSNRLDELGIAWSRIPGVDGHALTDTQLDDFRVQRSTGALSHAWSAGQIGCFLGHMACLRAIAAGSEDWAVVFEDDVHISPNLPRFLASSEWIPAGTDIVRFETTYQGMRLGPALDIGIHGFKLLPVKQHAWGAAAFAIRRDVARWLADAPARFHAPADWYFFHRPSTVAGCLTTFQLSPALCVQDQYRSKAAFSQGFQSNTDSNTPYKTPFQSKYKGLLAVGRRFIGKQLIHYQEDT